MADTFVELDSPAKNNGTKKELEVDGDSEKINRAFVSFDLSSIPAGSTVGSATLTLCFPGKPGGGAQGHIHELHVVTSSWTETGVTWDSQPTVSATVSDAITVPSVAQCVTFTVTSDVQGWVSGAANYGWLVNDQDEVTSDGSNSKYAAREHKTPDQRPQLMISYTPP